MNELEELDTEDLHTLYNLLGYTNNITDKETTLSNLLDNLSTLYQILMNLSDDFIVNLSDIISKIIYRRTNESVET